MSSPHAPGASTEQPAASLQASAIALYARATNGFAHRLRAAQAALQQAAHEHAGTLVQATSLGAEDMVITDLIHR
jgi:phosphoadenosine phosphosulfate reductase